MLFPYNRDMYPVYKFRELLPFQIHSLVTVKSWGYVGKNPDAIDGGEVGEQLITADFEQGLQEVDSVILGSFSKYYNNFGVVEEYLDKILAAGKNVIVLDSLIPEVIAHYAALFTAKEQIFLVMNNNFNHDNWPTLIPIPVVGVFGSAAGSGKLEMQVQLYRAMSKAGYRVLLLGPNPQINLFGGYMYPASFYRQDIGENQKIKLLRSFANKLIQKCQPDLLIISAPYGLNNYEEDRWGFNQGKTGLLAHIVMETFKPDANILCFIPGDLEWSKRAVQMIESLSLSPILAVAARRLLKIPTKAYEMVKYGLLDDELLNLYLDVWKEDLHSKFIDLLKVKDDDLVQLVEDVFDVHKRLESVI